MTAMAIPPRSVDRDLTTTGPSLHDVYGSTSNALVPRFARAIMPPVFVVATFVGITSDVARGRASLTPGGVGSTPLLSARSPPVKDRGPTDIAKSVRTLRERSGLSWSELAALLGVSRRTVHNWANGSAITSRHSRMLALVTKLVNKIDAGSPASTRARILAPAADGVTLYSQIVARSRPVLDAPELQFSPDHLLSAQPDTADPSGNLVDFEELSTGTPPP